MESTLSTRQACFRAMVGLFLLLMLLALSGCQGWYTEPDFGNAVRQAVQAQQVNPNAPVGNMTPSSGMDGPAAKSTIDNYERGFVNPRINKSNLGSISGQNTGGGSSTGSSSTNATGSATRP